MEDEETIICFNGVQIHIKVEGYSMKITKQDIKTLNKIKKMCDKIECEQCIFNTGECILQNQPNWWQIDLLEKGAEE